MLDLKARVHLQEHEGAVRGDEELRGAGVLVSGGRGYRDRRGSEPRAKGTVDAGAGGLLDELLVPPLDRAVAFAEPDDAPVAVREELDLDVTRVLDETLHEERGCAERRDRLARRGAPGGPELRRPGHDAHALAPATAGRLEQHRVADALRDGAGVGFGAERLHRPLGDRNAGGDGQPAGGGLLAEGPLHHPGRADEREPRRGHGVGEVGVLTEEAVARMDRVTAGPRGDRDDPLEAEVARRGRGGTDGIRLVRSAHVRRGPVDIAVHRDRRDPEVAAGSHHPERDLAAVGHEDLAEGRCAYSGMFPCFFFGFASRLPARAPRAAMSRGRVS